jgi:uncharacterized protein YeaO (DUF488 family)
MIATKRVYEETPAKGKTFLVERLWPRGIKKEDLDYDEWLKDVAPSTELRKWFSHDPAKYEQFRRKYYKELDSHPEAWQPILAAARKGTAPAPQDKSSACRTIWLAYPHSLSYQLMILTRS